jgi:oligopeptide/dipeptide ABC transporter ATP-binding protein
MNAQLEARDLVKHFPARERGLFTRSSDPVRALDGVSFTLERGRTLGLVGESGSGKSTTARILVGLERATSGSVKLDGVELTRLTQREWLPHRRRMQMIFQDPYASLDPRQTVASILEEPLAIHRLAKPRERTLRALELLDAVGLDARHLNRYPHEFSGGQRQRIGIARALALEPEILICDEPVSALDVSIQAQIVNLLKDLQERFELSLLFIAHDLALVRHVCDEVAVMYLGRIVESAPRDALFGESLHPYTRALLAAVPIADPELARSHRSRALRGDPPSPSRPPPGCAFHPRCSERENVPEHRCEREIPLLCARSAALPVRCESNTHEPRSAEAQSTEARHTCACHLYPARAGERVPHG